jgi:hypothetical protein
MVANRMPRAIAGLLETSKIARLFQNASVVCAVYVAAFSIVISS